MKFERRTPNVIIVLALLIMMIASVTPPAVSVARADSDQPSVSTEPVPAPIVIDGYEMTQSFRPTDPELDADDLFGGPLEENIVDNGFGLARTIVFAASIDPFDNAILGLDVFDTGRLSPWSINIDAEEQSQLMSQLTQVGGDWSIAATSGLKEVVDFEYSAGPTTRWSFFFENDFDDRTLLPNYASVTATSTTRSTGGVWERIAGWARDGDDVSTSSIEVLGQTGVRISQAFDDRETVAWTSDGFVFSLLAEENSERPEQQVRSSELVEQLQLIDQDEWVEIVRSTDSLFTPPPNLWRIALVVGINIAVVLAILEAIKLGKQWNRSRTSPSTPTG